MYVEGTCSADDYWNDFYFVGPVSVLYDGLSEGFICFVYLVDHCEDVVVRGDFAFDELQDSFPSVRRVRYYVLCVRVPYGSYCSYDVRFMVLRPEIFWEDAFWDCVFVMGWFIVCLSSFFLLCPSCRWRGFVVVY